MCKVVIATVDAIITDPENELEVIKKKSTNEDINQVCISFQLANALDTVCQLMPAYFVEECHFMLCTYYDELINTAVSEFGDPIKVCSFLTLCP